jgi:hypothetical protein
MHRLPLRLLTALLPLICSGCGYHISGSPEAEAGYAWHTLYRDDVKTVAVPIFSNRTPYQGIEFRLSKAIVTQLEAQSPYKVVPRERADTILEGEITRVRVRTVSRDRASAVPQEQLYLMMLNFHWQDLRTGKMLVERRDFEQTAPYYPTTGEDIFVADQSNIERLALAVVQELQADWGGKGNPTTAPATPPPSRSRKK